MAATAVSPAVAELERQLARHHDRARRASLKRASLAAEPEPTEAELERRRAQWIRTWSGQPTQRKQR